MVLQVIVGKRLRSDGQIRDRISIGKENNIAVGLVIDFEVNASDIGWDGESKIDR